MIEFLRELEPGSGRTSTVMCCVRVSDIISFWDVGEISTIVEVRQTGQIHAVASAKDIKRLVQQSGTVTSIGEIQDPIDQYVR